MQVTIYDVPYWDVEKYDAIFGQSVDALEETLQTLCQNYYKSIQENDIESTNAYLQELGKYLELNIPTLTEYIEGRLLSASNEILKKIIADDVPLYHPQLSNLEFKRYKDRQAERIIKRENLTESDVQLIVENNKARMDIYCLSMICDDKSVNDFRKPTLPPHLQDSMLQRMNYFADKEDYMSAKFFFAMTNYFGSDSE